MRVSTLIVAAVGLFMTKVQGDGYLISPTPRRISPKVLGELKVNLSVDVLKRLSVQSLHVLGTSERYQSQLGTLPCGGIPPDATNVHQVSAGGSIVFEWNTEERNPAVCSISLMCMDQTAIQLWSGVCGEPGNSQKKVSMPKDLRRIDSLGDCWLQWMMETSIKSTYVNCVDIISPDSNPSTTSAAVMTESSSVIETLTLTAKGAAVTTVEMSLTELASSGPGPEAGAPTATAAVGGTSTVEHISQMTLLYIAANDAPRAPTTNMAIFH